MSRLDLSPPIEAPPAGISTPRTLQTAPQALRRRDGVHPAQPAHGPDQARRGCPGHLSGHLTVEHLRARNSNLRNPIAQRPVILDLHLHAGWGWSP